MSVTTIESESEVTKRTARVDGDLESVRTALAARIDQLPRRNEHILIELGDGVEIAADLSTGTVSESTASINQPVTTLMVAPRYLARLMNGSLEPRAALLGGQMKFKGKVENAVHFLDELAGKRFPRNENFTDLALPSPTTDKSLARRQLEVFGYCIVKDALPPAQLKALQDRLDDQATAERAAGVAYLDGGRAASKERRGYRGDEETDEASAEEVVPNQRVWCLQNKGEEFIEILDNPVIDEIISPFLHQDQSGVRPTTPFAIGVNIIFCLDDFTEERGATRIIPGSHVAERGLAPDNIYTTQGTVPAEAPAGSAILVDTRIWHGTGASKSESRRRAAICLMQRSWTRCASNGVLAVHPSVLETMSDRVKAMFGHRVTDGLGAIQTEPEGTIIGWNPDQLLLKMHADGAAD
jgi:ectoine hydroxylase-related dioxygenase (phytanoyl-CoA dioxygenase family)